jgi:hypothetical protein
MALEKHLEALDSKLVAVFRLPDRTFETLLGGPHCNVEEGPNQARDRDSVPLCHFIRPKRHFVAANRPR